MSTEILDPHGKPAGNPHLARPGAAALASGVPGRFPRLPDSLTLAVCILGFALVPLFARPLMEGGLPAEIVAMLRFLPGLLMAAPMLPGLLRKDRAKRIAALAYLLAGMAVGVSWALYMEGLRTVPVAVAGTVYMSYPLLVVLLVWLFFRQRPAPRSILAGLVILLGAATLIGGTPATAGLWDPAVWLCLPAPLSFAVIVVMLARNVGDLTTLEKAGSAMSGTVLALAALSHWRDGFDPSVLATLFGDATLLLLAVGLMGLTATLPQMVYTVVVPRLPAARVATLGALELPFMVAIGWLAFGEALDIPEILAVLLIFAAIALAPTAPRAARPAGSSADR